MRVAVVACNGVFDSGLASVLDVLRTAEALRSRVDRSIAPIVVRTAGLGSTARTAAGSVVEIDHRLEEAGVPDVDLLVVPALAALDAVDLESALLQRDVRAVRGVLRELGADGRLELAAACTGTFLLAEAGLLDDHRATTTWWLTGLFTRRYPRVELDMSRMVVSSGPITTAGAAFAHIDLAIGLVSRASPALADATARHLLIDERPARSTDAALGHLAATDLLVSELETWLREHLAEPIEIADAARELSVTRRTLERHVRARLGTSPNMLLRRIRLEQAQHLRRTSELSLEAIAGRVGYASANTLRRALARS
jgi:transcriptional regulator GlxA family with amidase domain